MAALQNLERICEEHPAGKYRIEVVDLLQNPQWARGDQIPAVPALGRKLPEPMRTIIGDLSNTERALVGLDLRHVTGFVRLLEQKAEDRLDQESRRYVRIIREAAQRMGRLIDDLLRLSSGQRAGVSAAVLRVRRLGSCICLSVSDRGRGFNPQEIRDAAGFGLLNLRERSESLGGTHEDPQRRRARQHMLHRRLRGRRK